jgi:type IV pilus assembly protein PilY1
MKSNIKSIISTLFSSIYLLTSVVQATPIQVSSPRQLVPPNITTTSNKPMLLLAASKDHSLFGPIYTDFEDLDGDGIIDTTFKSTFKYYGYFDPTKCYTYNTTDKQFNPASIANLKSTTTTIGSNGTTTTTTLTVTTVDSSGSTSSTTTTTGTSTGTATTPAGTTSLYTYSCPVTQSYWSGNFLNWATMTRIDVVRKMLYGGTRSTDSTTSAGVGATVLERAKLNFDAHSFVKYYRGLDIRDYTPFTPADLIKTTGSNANTYAGLSICNLGTSDSASTNPNPPIMRMVKGNVRFWAAVEIRVCQWRENYSNVGTFGPKLARYYQDTDKGAGGIAHEITIPSITADGATYGGTGPELTVRVKVCDPNLLGEERCQAFPASSTTNYKPYGLFQEFGYPYTGGSARAEFGVITGSYDKNYTAGALRKNMGDFSDEINASTGVFCHSTSSGCATTLASPDNRATGKGAIKAFDAIILNDRSANTYGTSGTPSSVTEGALSAWGNPIGEMLVQALQYYSYNGTTPTPTNPTSTTKDTAVGAPVTAWLDPLSNSNTTRSSLYGNSVCRPLNVLLLSNSALSFDSGSASAFSTLPNAPSIDTYTDLVGYTEGFNNTLRSVGSINGGYGTSCSAKTVTTLSKVSGICPEAPAMGGTYQVAGAALYGNTNQIRSVSSPPTDLVNVKDALKVKTLAASLTGGAPRIDIPVPGTSNPIKYVYITPESVQAGGKISAPLTFASINSSSTYGSFLVTWNDILMGGDYDMDITGFIRYDLVDQNGTSNANGPYIKITTDIPGVCGGGAGTHGFSIIGVTDAAGTSQNGRYLTHQHYSSGILSGMPATSEYLCGDATYRAKTSTLFTGTYADTVCNVTGNGTTGDPTIPNLTSYCTVKNIDFPVSMTFKMVGESDALIKDPLFYAAKYGDFDSSTKNSDGTYTNILLPPSIASWDKLKTDGTLVTDGTPADGIPDGYFLARRPDLLEQQLRKALDSLAKNSNAAPVTTTGQLADGSYKYGAKFDSTDVTGNIEAYKADQYGVFDTTPTWQAGQVLKNRASSDYIAPKLPGDSRQIITNNGNISTTNPIAGIPFRWANLLASAPAYVTQMTTASTNKLSTSNAEITLNYIRGDQSLENASTGLRVRDSNLLGPIVNSTPWIQSAPSANYIESQFPGYGDFYNNQRNREKLLWVGANDGMLHAFCANDGRDKNLTAPTICPVSSSSSSTTYGPGNGKELFAYIPGALANRLAEIPLQRGTSSRTRLNNANFTLDAAETQPDSTVWAYVDGNSFSGDIKTNIIPKTTTSAEIGDWRTYLFSPFGRGGRGISALDVTDISKLSNGESNANSIFKWQFTSDDDNDLGYIISDISKNSNSGQANPIAKLNNNKFGIIIGNGYKSLSGKSALFILFVDGPSLTSGWTGQYIKIIADSGTGNGLMTPTWIDRNNDGTADVVYAGDLKGNLWKFDISSTNTSDWKIAYTTTSGGSTVNRPLFTAQYSNTTNGVTTISTLPITTAPEYVYPAFDGLIINFGTGNSFETGDFPKTGVTQRFFGVWDRPSFASVSTAPSGTTALIPTSMSTLVQRNYVLNTSTGVVTATADSTSGGISYTGIDWATKDGWYLNFPGTSEALNTNPELIASYLVFQTIRPKTTAINCYDTPNATGYIIDPIAGIAIRDAQGKASDGTLITGTAVADQRWVTVSNKTSTPYTSKACTSGSNCVNGQTIPPGPSQICKSLLRSSGKTDLCYNPLGRVQWREIPGLRTDQ